MIFYSAAKKTNKQIHICTSSRWNYSILQSSSFEFWFIDSKFESEFASFLNCSKLMVLDIVKYSSLSRARPQDCQTTARLVLLCCPFQEPNSAYAEDPFHLLIHGQSEKKNLKNFWHVFNSFYEVNRCFFFKFNPIQVLHVVFKATTCICSQTISRTTSPGKKKGFNIYRYL